MPATDQQINRVVDAYAASQASLITNLIQLLLGIWLPFRWWGRPDMVNALAAVSSVYVDLATDRARQNARAYAVQMLDMVDVEVRGLPPVAPTYARSGTSVLEVYKRPAHQVQHLIRAAVAESLGIEKPTPADINRALRTGPVIDLPDIEKVVANRIETLVEADIMTAARDEQQQVLDAAPEDVIGYRRILRPELSKTGPCGLCVVAADKFYTREDLLELHDRCKCTVAAITKTLDPGLRLNRAELDRLYAAAGSNYAEDLKRITVEVNEHGELGPILRHRGHKFVSVDEVNARTTRHTYTPYERPTRAADATNWTAMAAASERSIEILRDAKSRGTNLIDMLGDGNLTSVRDIDKAIEWHRSLIARAASRAA